MFARRPAFPWGGGSGRKGPALHIVWILAVVYLCGVLTVPLITISTNIVKPPARSSGGEGQTVLDVEPEVKASTQVQDVSDEATKSTSNPTTRRPQSKDKAESRPLHFNPQLGLDPKHPTDFYVFRRECGESVPDVGSYIIDKLFDGSSPYEDFPPNWASPYLQPSNAKGWGSKTKVFERLVEEVRPEVVIELGAFLGASAIHMANLTRHLGLHTTILAVDDFRGWAGFRKQYPNLKIAQINANVLLLYQFMQNVAAGGFQDSILPIPYATSSALTEFCNWGIKADLIEVDAGHDFHSAWLDINGAYNVLKPGGVMFGHDYFNKYDRMGVRRAVDIFAHTYGFTVEPDGQHWIMRGTP